MAKQINKGSEDITGLAKPLYNSGMARIIYETHNYTNHGQDSKNGRHFTHPHNQKIIIGIMVHN